MLTSQHRASVKTSPAIRSSHALHHYWIHRHLCSMFHHCSVGVCLMSRPMIHYHIISSNHILAASLHTNVYRPSSVRRCAVILQAGHFSTISRLAGTRISVGIFVFAASILRQHAKKRCETTFLILLQPVGLQALTLSSLESVSPDSCSCEAQTSDAKKNLFFRHDPHMNSVESRNTQYGV